MDKIVWKNTIDGKYLCSVTEQLTTCGILRLTEMETREVLLQKLVPISKYFRHQDILWWGQECLDHLEGMGYEVTNTLREEAVTVDGES